MCDFVEKPSNNIVISLAQVSNDLLIMEKEDMLLGMEMGRLEIEPVKINKNRYNENPFISLTLHRSSGSKSTTLLKESKCSCFSQRKDKPSGIYKKKHSKILKEPILNILKKCCNTTLETEESNNIKDITEAERYDPLSLCTLVDNCNQLTISSNANIQKTIVSGDNRASRWWKNDVSCPQEYKESKQQSSSSGSCSQEALNPPCDVTIDELASYFETLVHIPKKMSTMAEMMYI